MTEIFSRRTVGLPTDEPLPFYAVCLLHGCIKTKLCREQREETALCTFRSLIFLRFAQTYRFRRQKKSLNNYLSRRQNLFQNHYMFI